MRKEEDAILTELAKDKAILDLVTESDLAIKLEESKIMSKRIGKSILKIRSSMQTLMKTGKIYKPFTVRAAQFFFIVQGLEKLNPMYQFTHQWFEEFILNQVKTCVI